MTMEPYRSAALAAALSILSCGGDDATGLDGGARSDARVDSSVRDAAGGGDGAPMDATADPCARVSCTGFQHCVDGTCVEYPGCVTDDMCGELEVCLHRFCLPADADIDGDGDPAGTDCNETDPTIHTGATERCNLVDEDCDMIVDEGDPGELCADDPSGGECMGGTCGCPSGSFDLDRVASNGCECQAMPALDSGTSCGTPIELGDVSDTGQMMEVMGNVLPDDRAVWYHFRGVDTADTSCDNLYVRAHLSDDPDGAFGITVFRGSCTSFACEDMLYDDFTFATDFSAGGIGECTCAALTTGVNRCEDETADYYVRVTRRPGSDVTCAAYTLEISNGIYDS